MNATVLDRQSPTGSVSRMPARRAVLRWAWRLFRRDWHQQLLVLSLVTLAVAGTILGSAVGTNTPPPGAGFGTANTLANINGADPHRAADIAAIKSRFGAVDIIESKNLATGLVGGAQLRAQDPHGAFGSGMLALVAGRYPRVAGEVAPTRRLATTFGVHVGDQWQGARVVGLVENPQNLLDNFALVAPGALVAPEQVTVLFFEPREVITPTSHVQSVFTLLGVNLLRASKSSGLPPSIVVLAIAIFGLIFVGLVAAAGFTVSAQRRLRALGMLSSLGATDRHLRLVMIADGALIGIGGALAGFAIGFALWIPYAPHLQASTHHRIAWTNVPWWLIGTVMVLAVAAAILAARRPARDVARTSIVSALSGRPATLKPVHRSALPGAILLAIGIVLLAGSGGMSANGGKDTLFILGGLMAVAVGVLVMAPLAISSLGMIAGGAPAPVRIALRDLTRYRARSGPALAASSLAVLIAVFTCLIATGRFADAVDYFGPNLPANQLVVYAPGYDPGGGFGPGKLDPVGAQSDVANLQAQAAAVAAALGSSDVLELQSSGVGLERVSLGAARLGEEAIGVHGQIYVATPALLSYYGVDTETIDPSTLILTSRPGLEGTKSLWLTTTAAFGPDGSHCNVSNCVVDPKIQTSDRLPTDTSDPNLLVTPAAMTRLGLHATPAAWLIQTQRPLTSVQINKARQAAASAGMTIETKSDNLSLDRIRNYATSAGILLALGVLAMTVGLIRTEALAELRTLTVTGASSRTRRTLTAVTAGSLGVLAAALGTGVAYLGTIAFFRSELGRRMSHTPVLDLVLILIGLPLAAAAGGWVLAGREPPAISHQPIE